MKVQLFWRLSYEMLTFLKKNVELVFREQFMMIIRDSKKVVGYFGKKSISELGNFLKLFLKNPNFWKSVQKPRNFFVFQTTEKFINRIFQTGIKDDLFWIADYSETVHFWKKHTHFFQKTTFFMFHRFWLHFIW